jgi:hypothetical protein
VQNRENRKAAATIRGTAVLSCTAQGAPNITFTWRRQAGELATTTTNKYDISSRRLDPLTWQSRFTVRDVNSADYGGYECLARSAAEGAARAAVVALVEPSRPDTPAAFRVLNTTADAVSLAWRPGFNGGSDQIYRVEYYRKQEGSLYAQPSYYDVYPMNATSTVIMGLSAATRYAFSIQALNDLGESDFTFPTLEVTTLTGGGGGGSGGSVQANQPLVDELTDTASQSVPLIVTISVGVCGTLLLILSVVLVSCLLHKRRQKQQKKGSGNSSSSTTTSRSLASEASGKSGVGGAGGDGMLLFNGSQGTSCYNDTMSEETMSSISEKSGGSFISPPGEGRLSNGGGLIVVSTAYLLRTVTVFISQNDNLCYVDMVGPLYCQCCGTVSGIIVPDLLR